MPEELAVAGLPNVCKGFIASKGRAVLLAFTSANFRFAGMSEKCFCRIDFAVMDHSVDRYNFTEFSKRFNRLYLIDEKLAPLFVTRQAQNPLVYCVRIEKIFNHIRKAYRHKLCGRKKCDYYGRGER